MRHCLIFLAPLLAACTDLADPVPVALPHNVPPDLLAPCAGHLGPVPTTDGALSDALIAEVAGRRCANGKLVAIDEILNGSRPR